MACFTHTSLVWRPTRRNPLEFRDETYPAKTRGMGLPYGENFIILTSTVLTDPPVWQTDGRTDGRGVTLNAEDRIIGHVTWHYTFGVPFGEQLTDNPDSGSGIFHASANIMPIRCTRLIIYEDSTARQDSSGHFEKECARTCSHG